MNKKTVLLSWSSGKDCAWALQQLREDPDVQVVGLFTTLNQAVERVAIHGVQKALLQAQAASVGLPITLLPLPWPCSNEDYEQVMAQFFAGLSVQGISHIAFGDIFLADVRAYRERQLLGTGLMPLFPLWGMASQTLAHSMIEHGVKARICALDSQQLAPQLLGHEFDDALQNALPAQVDPCGERGEFHTFVYDGPMFNQPLNIRLGERVQCDVMWFVDLVLVPSG